MGQRRAEPGSAGQPPGRRAAPPEALRRSEPLVVLARRLVTAQMTKISVRKRVVGGTHGAVGGVLCCTSSRRLLRLRPLTLTAGIQ